MSWVHLTNVSGNRKVGPIKVTTTEKSSCPAECGVMDECYAGGGPLAIHWNKVGEGQRGDNWEAFTKRVRRFHKNELWRHNQAGDLPPNEDGKLDEQKCEQLANAASHTNGWTYTHYDPTDSHNNSVIKAMNEVGGLVVNLSADTMEQAETYHELGIAPVTVVLPEDAPDMGNKTPNGLPIVICPYLARIRHCTRYRCVVGRCPEYCKQNAKLLADCGLSGSNSGRYGLQSL